MWYTGPEASVVHWQVWYTGPAACMIFIPLFFLPGLKKNIAFSSPELVMFPPVFGPYKTGLCFAVLFVQALIHEDP